MTVAGTERRRAATLGAAAEVEAKERGWRVSSGATTDTRNADARLRNLVPPTRQVAEVPRIGVLYPSGWGNLGDEAILQATFQALRQRWPNAELRAFTLNPARTAANHGVTAEPLTGLARPLFGAPRDGEPFPVRAARSIARRTRGIPVVEKLTRWASDRTADVVFETKSLVSAWRWISTADLLLASGGGQLDDVWGGAWGQPYALARWAWLAKRAGVPFAFLSVGFGGASTPLSRRLLRYAIEKSDYCSVRDAGSRELTAGLGIARDIPVVPDLAFGLSPGSPSPRRQSGIDIGISPMVYLRPGSWPKENEAEYERLIGLWSSLVAACVDGGDRVQLFVSDPEDMRAVADVWNQLSEPVRAGTSINHAANPDALLEFYRGVDVVISSRLHGVLLAMVAARPVLALSHERKVRTVMSDAGVSNFCTELKAATVGDTMRMLRDLTDPASTCGERLRAYVAEASAAVNRQQELLPPLMKRI